MAYDKQAWANGVAGGTPIDADALNHIEAGIEAAAATADAALTASTGVVSDEELAAALDTIGTTNASANTVVRRSAEATADFYAVTVSAQNESYHVARKDYVDSGDADLSGRIDALTAPSGQPGLGILRAGLTQRATTPCRLVFTGSSTTQGANATTPANRYVNRLVSMIQAAYPSTGTETTVVDSATATFGALSTAGGVHGYNAGEGGTTAVDYLTAGEITTIAAMKPRAVFHMVGSNDWGENVAPDTYKLNVQDKVAAFKAAQTEPCVHVLIQTFQRADVPAPTYPWSEYGRVLREIAAADPDNVAFLDISGFYPPTGILGADPLNLIDTDNLHQTDAGHAFMADLLRLQLGVVSTAAASSGATGVTRTVARITSDGFGGTAGDLNVRTSDAALGGVGKAWSASGAGAVVTSSNTAIRGGTAANWFVGLAETTADIELSAVIATRPTAGSLYLDLHRATVAISPAPDSYRLDIRATQAQLLKRTGGGTTATFGPFINYAAGDRLALRYYKGTVEFRINGAVVQTATDATVPNAAFAGLAGTSDSAGWVIDNLTIDAVT